PFGITAGAFMQFSSARPFSAVTGVDNNGDGLNNDRPVVDGAVLGRSTFRSTPTYDVSLYLEDRVKLKERLSLILRIEGFNLTNHGNYLGRGQITYGDTATVNSTFGQL